MGTLRTAFVWGAGLTLGIICVAIVLTIIGNILGGILNIVEDALDELASKLRMRRLERTREKYLRSDRDE